MRSVIPSEGEIVYVMSTFATSSFSTDHTHHNDQDSFPRLAPREQETLELVLKGLPSQSIADRMFISKRTVDFHLHSIFRKLRVKNRVQALVRAEHLGLLREQAEMA